MVQHASLTGAELHESKGVAAATVNQLYFANGAGSGTWRVLAYSDIPTGESVQAVYASTGTYTSSTNTIPYDNTIPQSGEGTQLLTATITPLSVTNTIIVTAVVYLTNNTNQQGNAIALFKDAETGARAAGIGNNSGSITHPVTLRYQMVPGSLSATTFKIRYGGLSGTTYVNGDTSGQKYGGVLLSTLTIEERKA